LHKNENKIKNPPENRRIFLLPKFYFVMGYTAKPNKGFVNFSSEILQNR